MPSFDPQTVAKGIQAARTDNVPDDQIYQHLASKYPEFASMQNDNVPFDAVATRLGVPHGTQPDYGSISEPQNPGLMAKITGGIRNIFEPTIEGGPGNLAQLATAPIRMLSHSGEPADVVAQTAAQAMGKAGVPAPVSAAISTAGAIAGDPLNYVPGAKGGYQHFFTPGTMLETAQELAPALKAGISKLGEVPGMIKGAMKSAESLGPASSKVPDTLALAQKAEAANIPFTPSALKPGDVTEKAFMGNQQLNDITGKFKAAQDQALDQHLQNTAQKYFGPDTLTKDAGQRGEQIQQAIENFKTKRNADFGQAEQAITNQVPAGKLPTEPKPIGIEPSNKIYDFIDKSGVTKQNGEFVLKGTEKNGVTQDVLDSLVDMAKRMRNSENIGDLLAAKRNFIADYGVKFGQMPGAADAITQKALGFANDAIQSALNNVPDAVKPAAKTWLKIRDLYANTQQPLKDAYATMAKSSPEDFYQKLILNKGSKAVEDLKPILGDNISVVQKAALEDMVNKANLAKDSSAAMNTYWKKTLDPDLKKALFTPEQQQAIQDHLDIRNFVQAPQYVSGTQRIGGSQTGALTAIAKGATGAAGKATLGAAAGFAGGGPAGALIGGAAGATVDQIQKAMAMRKAMQFFNPARGFYNAPKIAQTAQIAFKLPQSFWPKAGVAAYNTMQPQQ